MCADFSANKHAYTDNLCAFDCLPYHVKPGCSVACTDLLTVQDILQRVREYTGSTARPSYTLGKCGSTDAIPLSTLPFLRKGRWASRATDPQACGNMLLNAAETCDDGNTQSGKLG